MYMRLTTSFVCLSLASLQAENVGTGAVAAAQLHASADISSLVTWQPGKPVPYAFLAETFESIASTTKRLEIIVTLTSAFRAILASTPEDLVPAVYLCGNRVAPPHDGMELGLGEALLLKVGGRRAGREGKETQESPRREWREQRKLRVV
jgi:DNA ligase-1